MYDLQRITVDPAVMGGNPCIRGLRVTVGTVVGLVAFGYDVDRILRLYPYLEADDIREALAYAAWRAKEFEVPLHFFIGFSSVQPGLPSPSLKWYVHFRLITNSLSV